MRCRLAAEVLESRPRQAAPTRAGHSPVKHFIVQHPIMGRLREDIQRRRAEAFMLQREGFEDEPLRGEVVE